MGSIRILPDPLVNQIAAGEVIERPASVVKELVENAIDAEAKTITIEIVKGGIEKMVVTDDGRGMDESDARLAFERHATSKIASTDDLFNIRSLGFRGEALASIASVSKIVLHTKLKSSLSGVRLSMEGGKSPELTTWGCPEGTKLEITDLFFNTPARKKYLKSDQTEYRHVLETVQDLALAHPEITFRFVSNGRTLFDLLKTDQLLSRIGGLFGKSISGEMVEVFYGGRDLQVSGYVGKPHTARATRKYQYFIINGRPVCDVRLSYAVKEAYSNTIPSLQQPIFVLTLTLDPKRLDVNVHPRKLEVRFADPQEIFRVLKSTVHAALERTPLTRNLPLRDRNFDMPAFLRKASLIPAQKMELPIEEIGAEYDATVAVDGLGPRPSPLAPTPSVPTGGFSFLDSPHVQNDLMTRKAYLLQKRAERLAERGLSLNERGLSFDEPRDHVDLISTVQPAGFQPLGLQPLTQVANRYIVAQDDKGIVIIDQHAAHERVLLGRLRHSERERNSAQQRLLTPLHLTLDYREKAVLEEHLELLGSLGFELHEFGPNTYTLDAVPDFIVQEDLELVMKGFIDDLLNDHLPQEAARRHEHILHTLACRAAAKFGRRLTSTEQDALIRSLQITEENCACAHGRPTMIRLSFNELEQKFGRKG